MRLFEFFRERGGIQWRRTVAALIAVIGLLPGAGRAQEKAPMTEYQVKALCVLNFAKYVDWPATAFSGSDAPLTIAVLGDSEVADVLEAAVKGKRVGGRAVEIERIKNVEGAGPFQILFVSAGENGRLPGIFSGVKGRPILTIGESGAFEESGGMINFVLKNNKVRFDINLTTATDAGMRISSKLLTLADSVQGNSR